MVHPDKVPMVPGFGQQPRFIVTIQPSGALFNPPAPITLPNVDGLAPREVTEMYSFDHDIGSFVAIGTGTVSDDGLVIRSSQGVGVLKAGWHCGGNPNQPGTVATCPLCSFCQGTTCTPQGNGTSCGNGGTCQFTGPTTVPACNCSNGGVLNTTTAACPGPCLPGSTVINGLCCQGGSCNPPPCPPGTVFDSATMTCVTNSPCPPGFTLSNGQCCQGNSCIPPQCPPGLMFNAATGTCVNSGPCPPGYTLNNGQCCQGGTCIPPSCPSGQIFDPVTGTCVNGPCPPGCSACVTTGGTQQCTQCSNGQPPVNRQCCASGACPGNCSTVSLTASFASGSTPAQTFVGEQANPFDPTNTLFPGNHFAVLYKDVVDRASSGTPPFQFGVRPFDVSLSASNSCSQPPNPLWQIRSGPVGGTLSPVNSSSALLQNPTQGGTYKITYVADSSSPPSTPSEANVVLPLAGADVTQQMITDITLANQFAARVTARYTTIEINTNVAKLYEWFFTAGAGDYRGRPNSQASQSTQFYNQVGSTSGGLASVATWYGVPVRTAKMSNFIVAYAMQKIGVISPVQWLANNTPIITGTPNDAAADASWQAGVDLASGKITLAGVQAFVKDIFDKADEKNTRLWPNPVRADNFVPSITFDSSDSLMVESVFTHPGFLELMNP